MGWFSRKAPPPPKGWTGPESFADWTDDDIAEMSKAIRSAGQPDSSGFRTIALIALNTLRGGSAVELVARAIEESHNPGSDPDQPIHGSHIHGSHYLRGMPHWCMWVEYARPAVEAYARHFKKQKEAA